MKYRNILEALPYPAAVVSGDDLKLIEFNSAFSRLAGSTPLQGSGVADTFPEVADLISSPLSREGKLTQRIYVKRGEEALPVELSVSRIGRRTRNLLVVLRDLSGGAQRQLENLQKLYRALSRANFLVTSSRGIMEMVSGCVDALFESQLFSYVALLPKSGTRAYAERGVYTGKESAVCIEIEEGERSCYLLVSKGRGESFAPAELDLLSEVAHDIAYGFKRLRMEAREERSLHTDSLTGLPNRLHFIKYLEQTLSFARSSGKSVALLILDVDRFGEINQALGQSAGDRMLASIAAAIRSLVRKTDFIARTGSDEFAVLLVSEDPVRAVTEFVKRVRRKFSEPVEVNSHSVYVTFSAGVSVYPADTDAPDTLCANATASLQRSKRTGGNNVVFFSEEVTRADAASLRFRTDLRNALNRSEFVLYYQPKIDLRSGSVIGAEALIRWVHNGEVIPPARFLPFIEEGELIHEVGLWVLREACRQIREWHSRGINIPVAINISASQLKLASFAGGFPFVTAGCGDTLKMLEVEITESALMEDPARAVEFINTLTSYGVKTYIDDFGTGYSSLAYLKKLPVYAIKIDREFVKDFPADRDSLEIVKATLGLAKAFGLKTVAEGVERETQAEFLRELGCDYAQGYLFSPPLPAAEFEAYMGRSS